MGPRWWVGIAEVTVLIWFCLQIWYHGGWAWVGMAALGGRRQVGGGGAGWPHPFLIFCC
jgi:hypothetical protein